MAYKQSPGRSPFLKTGRDIPLNMISPLHNEGDHKHPHENGISKDDDVFGPPVEGKTIPYPKEMSTTNLIKSYNTGQTNLSSLSQIDRYDKIKRDKASGMGAESHIQEFKNRLGDKEAQEFLKSLKMK